MDRTLAHAVIQTLAYFDIFDLPLTAEELYRSLWQYSAPVSYADFLGALPRIEGVDAQDGWYMLSGRGDIVAARQLAAPLVEKKLLIARRAAKMMRWIPFLRAMFVCNTVASASASENSDIDVFIIVRQGRLWITRFLTTAFMGAFRLRRTKTNVANKICLSFYITDAHLDLSDIAIDEPDIYLMYWLDQLVPVFDPDGLREELLAANQWAGTHLPHGFRPYNISGRYRVDTTPASRLFRRMFERLWRDAYGDMLERRAKEFQKKKMAMNVESIQGLPDTRVVVDDTMLKFHEHDRRAYFRDAWHKRLAAYDIYI